MNNPKSIFTAVFLTMIIIFISQSIVAQYGAGQRDFKEHKEKIKTHKIAYITDKLDLSPEEAEKFWPVYNKHQEEMESSNKKFGEKYHDKVENITILSDWEAEEFVNARLEHEQQQLDSKKVFISDLKTILPSKKIILLMEAERDFRVELMKKLAGRGGPGTGPTGRR